MFLGHFGLAFASKKLKQRPSLGTYFLAAQFIDLIWPIFLIAGIETVKIDPGNTAFTPLDFISYPYSHSLIAVLAWSVIFGLVYYLIRKDRGSSFLLGALVMSHWLLDLVTHRPDLSLSPWTDSKYGFGLWNNVIATIMLELLLFLVGVYLYLTSTLPKNNIGKYSLWVLVIFMLVVYFMNAFGPPPPSEEAIGFAGFSQWLLIAWGYWIDRNRRDIPLAERKYLHHQIE
jgi:membrane-bound metal-dependent hydrolase YbcI (DUF457 family)